MGVLSLGNEKVWQANSAMIRLLISHIKVTDETAQWLETAKLNFDIYQHFDLAEAEQAVMLQIRNAAVKVASESEVDGIIRVFNDLIQLIDNRAKPPLKGLPHAS